MYPLSIYKRLKPVFHINTTYREVKIVFLARLEPTS